MAKSKIKDTVPSWPLKRPSDPRKLTMDHNHRLLWATVSAMATVSVAMLVVYLWSQSK